MWLFLLYSKVIHLCIYIYLCFFRFFSHRDYQRILDRVPCAIQQVSIDSQSIYYSVHMPSQTLSPPLPLPPVCFVNHKIVFNVCESVYVLQISSCVSPPFFFLIPHISYTVRCLLYDLFHLVWKSLGPSMFLWIAIFHYFYGLVIFYCIYYCIFFIHSSINGHLGCFHVLAW